MESVKEEIAATAARLVVEEGLEYGPAKRRAVKQLGLPGRSGLPDNDQIERAVEEYIAIFCAETQPPELRALRELALTWLQRLERFRPHLGGSVWRGTATRHSDIYIQLFCDDPKAAEIALIDMGIRFDVTAVNGLQGEAVDALSVHAMCPALGVSVGVHLMVYDYEALRGALRPDVHGSKPRGDARALQALLQMGETI
jgi:hypothetical protein